MRAPIYRQARVTLDSQGRAELEQLLGEFDEAVKAAAAASDPARAQPVTLVRLFAIQTGGGVDGGS